MKLKDIYSFFKTEKVHVYSTDGKIMCTISNIDNKAYDVDNSTVVGISISSSFTNILLVRVAI